MDKPLWRLHVINTEPILSEKILTTYQETTSGAAWPCKCLSVSYPQRWWKCILQKKQNNNKNYSCCALDIVKRKKGMKAEKSRRVHQENHPHHNYSKHVKLIMQCCRKVFWFRSFSMNSNIYNTPPLHCCWENTAAGKKKKKNWWCKLLRDSQNMLLMKKSTQADTRRAVGDRRCVSVCVFGMKLKGKAKIVYK